MKSTSSSTADWRKPLLEFLRNGASISVLSALTIVAGHNIHLSWSFSIGGPLIVFAMMLLVAIVATYANITCFFDGVVNSAMDKAGLGHRFDAIDKADINNMVRVWTKLVFTWRERKSIFFEVILMELVVLVGMTGSIITAIRAALIMMSGHS